MKLLRPDDLPRFSRETVFRTPPFASCAAFLVFTLLAAGTQAFLWTQGLWWIAILFIPMWLLVLPALFTAARDSFTADNWVLRAGAEGLMLQLRSYANRHFPRDCETVVYLAWEEVAGASGFLERQRLPRGLHSAVGVERRHRILELELGTDTEELRQAILRERERKAPKIGISRSKSSHYPVTVVSPGVVRVAFGGLSPGLDRALEILGERAPCKRELRRLDVDWEGLEGRELERFIVRLYREGDTLSADSIVQRRYGVSLIEARDYVERLARESL